MLDESLLNKNINARALYPKERDIIEALLKHQNVLDLFISFLDIVSVADMQDGGMGSIQFEPYMSRTYGKEIAGAQYIDADGTPISIVLNVDKNDVLYELDFWKVDFSKLIRYPNAEDLNFDDNS